MPDSTATKAASYTTPWDIIPIDYNRKTPKPATDMLQDNSDLQGSL